MSSNAEAPDARRNLTGKQCRAARGMLGWSQEALARKAGTHWVTVQNFEGGRPGTFPMRYKLRAALEAGGVEFTAGEPGVRLRAAP